MHLVLSCSGLSFLHRGPKNGEKVILNGRHKSIGFSVQIKKDLLIWDELLEHSAKISACSTSGSNVQFDLHGPSLESSDFRTGTAFVINKEHFQTECHKFESEHSTGDSIHFFTIKSAKFQHTKKGLLVSLVLKSTHGSQVVPHGTYMKLDRTQRHFRSSEIEFLQYDPTVVQTVKKSQPKKTNRQVIGNIIDTNPIPTFPTPNIPNPNVENSVVVIPGVTINTTARLDASVGKLSFDRSLKLDVSWEQTLNIDYASRLTAKQKYIATDRKQVYRREISDFYYYRRILFLGTIEVKGYAIMDLTVSVSIDQQIDAYVAATHENIMKVSARLSSAALSIESLTPAGFENAGDAVIDYEKAILDEFGITGFYGYEAGIELNGNVFRDKYQVRTTVALGLEADYRRRFPPFQPISEAEGSSFGLCKTCHLVEAKGKIVGKDLKSKLFQDGKLRKEKVHTSSLFDIPLATVCLLESPC